MDFPFDNWNGVLRLHWDNNENQDTKINKTLQFILELLHVQPEKYFYGIYQKGPTLSSI